MNSIFFLISANPVYPIRCCLNKKKNHTNPHRWTAWDKSRIGSAIGRQSGWKMAARMIRGRDWLDIDHLCPFPQRVILLKFLSRVCLPNRYWGRVGANVCSVSLFPQTWRLFGGATKGMVAWGWLWDLGRWILAFGVASLIGIWEGDGALWPGKVNFRWG